MICPVSYLQTIIFIASTRHNIMVCARFTCVYIGTIENSTVIIVVVWCCCCCCCWCRCCCCRRFRCYYCCYYYLLLFCAQINNRTTIWYTFYNILVWPRPIFHYHFAATNMPRQIYGTPIIVIYYSDVCREWSYDYKFKSTWYDTNYRDHLCTIIVYTSHRINTSHTI